MMFLLVATATIPGCGARSGNSMSQAPAPGQPVLLAFRDSTRTCGTPVYPPSAAVQALDGRVVLTVFVDTSGVAIRDSLRVVSATDSVFVSPAKDFVLACRYTVPRVRGQAVPTQLTIPVSFTVQGGGRVSYPGRRPQRP